MCAFYRPNVSSTIIDVSKSQRMQCVVSHNVQQEDFVQNNIQCHKGLITYNKMHGTTTMNKHVFTKLSVMLNLY
jgi:hypothetical protein